MSKGQIIWMVCGIAAVLGLSFLPNVVVKKKEVSQAMEIDPTVREPIVPMDHASLSALDRKELDSLKRLYQEAPLDQKEPALDRLIEKLTFLNKYDSAAIYAEKYWETTNDDKDLLRAGNLYYETFTFASFNPTKARAYGLRTRELLKDYVYRNAEDLDATVKLGSVMVAVDSMPMDGIWVVRNVLTKNPNQKLALFQLGMFSIESGQYKKAVQRFGKLSELEPKNIQYRFYHGVSLAESGQKEEARKELAYVKANAKSKDVLESVEQYLLRLE